MSNEPPIDPRGYAETEATFRCFVERYQSEILALTFALEGNQDAAEELALKVFQRAYRERESCDASGWTRSWLYMFAFGECIRQARKEQATRVLRVVKDVLLCRTVAENEGRGEKVTEREFRLRKALGTLSPRARVLLLLREIAHQPLSDLALIARTDVRKVREELFLARLALSKKQ